LLAGKFAQFAQNLFLSLMSNFKNAKGKWISLHRHGSVCTGTVVPNSEINMPLDIPKRETAKNPGVSISDFGSFYFGISGVSISGFLHGKQKLQHHEVPNAEIPKP
jgi:hypothetical protein